jgi:hypothetical protein
VNQLELTVSLVFALFLWNWRDIIPGAELMNVSQKDSQIAHLDVTYVPDASLSDAKSWSAWQTNASRSNTTQAYVRPSSSTTDNTNPSANSSGGTSNANEGHAVSVTPTQKLWKGESWADGIIIEDPDAEASPEIQGTANESATSQKDSELTPNLLPNFWEEGSRSTPTQQPKTTSPQLDVLPNPSLKKPTTIVPVAVTVASASNSASSKTTVNSSLDVEDSSVSDMVPWGFAIPSVVGGLGLAGVGYCLLKRGNRHSKA